MASSTTKLSDIINPEVMGNMIAAKIAALCKLLPYAKVDTSLEGVPGDTKTVPAWNFIGEAEDFDVEAGGEIETAKMTATSTTFTIKCIAKAVSIFQTAINSGLGDPVGQANTQLAKSIMGKIDSDLVAAAYTATMKSTSAGQIGYSGIVDAVTKFEDEEDGIEKVMFIHPQQETTLLQDPAFLSADKFTGGVAVNGAIGKVAGCWVKKSKKVRKNLEEGTSGESGYIAANTYWENPIIKMEPDSAETEYTEDELPALTIFMKKDLQVDHEWFPKKQRHDITASEYCGIALTNNAKVVIGRFKVDATV